MGFNQLFEKNISKKLTLIWCKNAFPLKEIPSSPEYVMPSALHTYGVTWPHPKDKITLA